MPVLYWIGNGAPANSNVASNWALGPPGVPVSGAIPASNDTIHIGHETTLAAGLGSADCVWNSTGLSLVAIHTYEGYRYSTTITSTSISFTATNTLTITNGEKWADYGFRVGMYITTAGAATGSNNGNSTIASITHNVMTVTGLTITSGADGPSITVSSSSSLNLTADVTTQTLSLDCTLKNTTAANKTITFDMPIVPPQNRYILNGDNASILNQDDITYNYNGNSGADPGGIINFDNGPYPKLLITAPLDLTSDYVHPPTSNQNDAVEIYSLDVTHLSSTWSSSAGGTKLNNISKTFKLLTTSTLNFEPTVWDTGESSWHFKVNTTGFIFPVSGITTYGANDGTFIASWYNVTLTTPATDGIKTVIGAGRTLNLNSLTVEAGAVFEGYATKGQSETSVVTSVKRPVIQGAWNFSQLADGIYSSVLSDTYPITPANGPGGRIQISDYAGKFKSDANFVWDSANTRLGVGEPSPDKTLHLKSSGSNQPTLLLENTNADAQEATMYFRKNTASPAAGDDLGIIRFEGEDSGGANTLYAYLSAEMRDPTNTQECGKVNFYMMHQGTSRRLFLMQGHGTAGGQVYVNDGNHDIDFVVDTSGTTGMIKTDGGTNALGIFGATPVVRPATGGTAATYGPGAPSAPMSTNDTYDGYTLAQVVKALRDIGILT